MPSDKECIEQLKETERIRNKILEALQKLFNSIEMDNKIEFKDGSEATLMPVEHPHSELGLPTAKVAFKFPLPKESYVRFKITFDGWVNKLED